MESASSDEIILRYADDYTTVFESMLDVVRRLGKADKPNRDEGILSGNVTANMPFTWSELRVVIHVVRAQECTEVRIRMTSAQIAPGEAQRLDGALKVAARFALGARELSVLDGR
jgi:hypothetical protein